MRRRPNRPVWSLVSLVVLTAYAAPWPGAHVSSAAGGPESQVELPIGVPTGVLYDRVLPLSRIERFQGQPGTQAAPLSVFRQIVHELRRASDAPGALPDRDALAGLARAGSTQGVFPLAVVDFAYDRLTSEAASGSGVGGLGTEHRVFAAAALENRTWNGSRVAFRIERTEYFTNRTSLPRWLEIDFEDGQGWRPIAFGHNQVASYDRAGEKTVRLRAGFDDASTLEAAFPFGVETLGTPSPDDTLAITATIPYQGQTGTGRAYVYRAPGHTSLVNPVIVVEGFDLDNTMDWEELYASLNQENLLETLRADGFDAVVLDFTDATDAIQKNAFVLTELIGQVEASVSPQTTVALVGASMGGLVGRYALAHLEFFGSGHRVRTFLSFDAPHGGANIPLGIQYWVNFFAGESVEAATLRDLLNRPAARQMLVYHFTDPPSATGTSDPQRATLLSDFAAIGSYPSGPRRVAVANGSGHGLGQGFAPGAQIIEWGYSAPPFVGITGDVWAVPSGVTQMIFDGRIQIFFSTTQQSVTVSATQPFDNAPGGSRATMAEMDAVAAPFGDIVALHGSHCFIPTISALDLDTSDLFYDVAGDPDLLSHTPFDAVYFPAANEAHVTITPQSAIFVRDEIEAGVTGVSLPHAASAGLRLGPGARNPFVAEARLAATLPAAGGVDLAVFGIDGRLVRRLMRGQQSAGRHDVVWSGRDEAGRSVPAGLYFARLRTDHGVATTRLVKID